MADGFDADPAPRCEHSFEVLFRGAEGEFHQAAFGGELQGLEEVCRFVPSAGIALRHAASNYDRRAARKEPSRLAF